MAGDLVPLFDFLQLHPVLPLGLGLGQQRESRLQGLVPHREGQRGVQGVGNLQASPGYGAKALLILGDVPLLQQRGQGILHLKVIGQALFLDDAGKVLPGEGRPNACQDVAKQNADVVFVPKAAGLYAGGKSILLHGQTSFL